MNLYEITATETFSGHPLPPDALLSALVAAPDDPEARRIAFSFAVVTHETAMESMLSPHEPGDTLHCYELDSVQEYAPKYHLHAEKFLDEDKSRISLLGTSVEHEPQVIQHETFSD